MDFVYTFSMLKDSIYKALDTFSVNGQRISASYGEAADTENRFLQTLNVCLRRICLSFPLCEKSAELTLTNNGVDACEISASLPDDCYKPTAVFSGVHKLPIDSFSVQDDVLWTSGEDPLTIRLLYAVSCPMFTADTPPDTPVQLPALTADALVYLTAAELCSSEDSELYTRLMYKYRDLALNIYNAERKGGGRNTFYQNTRRRSFRKAAR